LYHYEEALRVGDNTGSALAGWLVWVFQVCSDGGDGKGKECVEPMMK
jgi:hypothetical protein